MTYKEAINKLYNSETYDEGLEEAINIAIEALENCPPKVSLCYGCHGNCDKCESLSILAMC